MACAILVKDIEKKFVCNYLEFWPVSKDNCDMTEKLSKVTFKA